MKHSIFLLITCSSLHFSSFSQEIQIQLDTITRKSNPVLGKEKPKFLENVNMIANLRFASNNNFINSNFVESKFVMNEIRMEIIGEVAEGITFRFRDVYNNRPTDPQTMDGLRHSIDMAYVEVAVSPKLSIAAGKMASDWGSYEFDINPVYIYAYNDLVQYGDHFLSGVQARWKALPKHTLSFQIINSRTKSFEELYGTIPGLESSKIPLGGTINWRGKFADGKFNTLWSYSVYNEARNRNMNYLALGNQLSLGKLTLQYDFKHSNEALDRTGVLSSLIIPTSIYSYPAQDVRYIEHWLRSEYFFAPKWSATIIGMVSSGYWRNNPIITDLAKTDLLRTAWSFTTAIEHHIYKPHHVKLFIAYIGRYNNFSNYAKQEFGFSNNNNGQILIGILSPLLIF